jgi:L-asparaginase
MGELAIRAGTARTVVHGLRTGLGVEAACRDALADLRRLERRFVGGMTIHAIDAAGNPAVVAVGRETSAVRWFHWHEGMDAAAEHHTVVEPW